MVQETKKTELITELLLQVISLPTSRTGLRLRPEEELASILKVGRRRIREALASLEKRGFLLRRRGSGTYIRTIPTIGNAKCTNILIDDLQLSADDFFTDAPKTCNWAHDTFGPENSIAKKLRIELWKDQHGMASVELAAIDGMIYRASEMHHSLSIHSLVATRNVPYDISSLKQKLSVSTADGYIVSGRWADLFMEALGPSDKPVIFYSFSGRPFIREPYIVQNTAEAIERSIRILRQYGYEKIAAITPISDEHIAYLDEDAYNCAMRRSDIDYRMHIKTSNNINMAINATLDLLSSKNRPDAIYSGDNFVLEGIVAAMNIKKLVPGKDIAVITHSNAEHPLPPEYNWSRIEFNLHAYGYRLIDELLKKIQNANVPVSSMMILGKWIPGNTHILEHMNS